MPKEAGARARILEAARTEFAEYGYAGSRVARIARRARVNKQLLYYYFGSKTGLHEAASSPAAPTGVSGSWREGRGAAPERLRGAIGHLFAELRDHPEIVALLVDRQGSGGAAVAARDFTANVLLELANLISEGQGMGYFGDRVDPAEAAGKALVLCAGYLALEPILPEAARSRGTWSAEVSTLLLKAIAW
jgi:TetR/AcrR family transcriptional regulator